MKALWARKKPQLEATWNHNLQRWSRAAGINPYGMSVKMTKRQ